LEIEIGFRPGQRLWHLARFINGADDAISFLAQVSRREAQALLLIAKAIKAGLTNEVAPMRGRRSLRLERMVAFAA